MPHGALYDHQQGHFERMRDTLRRSGVVGDMSETGTGKTAVALALAHSAAVVPLVICPASVAPAWRTLAKKLGLPAQVVSYQFALRNLCKVQRVGATGKRVELKDVPDFVVLDEAHLTKGDKSLTSKMAISLKRQGVSNIVLASATLIGDPTNLKAIGYLLGLHNFTNYWNWLLMNGCRPGYFGGIEFTKDPIQRGRAMNKISASLVGKVHMMRRADIPNFPETAIETILFEDDNGKAQKLSLEIADAIANRREQRALLEDEIDDIRARGDVIEGSPAHQFMLLELRKRQELELLKVPPLVEMAAKYGPLGGVSIFVNFNETLDALKTEIEKHLGPVGTVRGGQAPAARESVVTEFQQGRLPFIILNIRAGGAGLSLQADDGVTERTSLISPNYSAIDLKQVLGRPHRLGGGFSRQFICLFDNETDRRVKEVLDIRLANLDAISDSDLLPK